MNINYSINVAKLLTGVDFTVVYINPEEIIQTD